MRSKYLPNQPLRAELKKADIPFWLLGKKLDVSERTITRWLTNDPLPEEIESSIRNAMSALIEERHNGEGKE